MALSSSSTLQNEISTKLLSALSSESVALSMGSVQKLARSATSVKVPTLSSAPTAGVTLEGVTIGTADPSMVDSGGTLVSIKTRVVCSAEYEQDVASINWQSLSASSIARRVDALVMAACHTAATSAGGSLSAGTFAAGAAVLNARDLQSAILVAAPTQAAAVYPLLDAGKVYGVHPMVWSDDLPVGCSALLLPAWAMLVCLPPDAMSHSRDDQHGAEDDLIGHTTRLRCWAGAVLGVPMATFA